MTTVEALREFKLHIMERIRQDYEPYPSKHQITDIIEKEYQIILEKLVEMK